MPVKFMAHRNGTTQAVRHKTADMFDLSGRTAVIVGGAGKMGTQFGYTLAAAGATVILVDKDVERCKKVAHEISKATRKSVQDYCLDGGDEAHVHNMFHSINRDHQRVDILIYNVMAKPDGYYKSTTDYEVTTWNDTISGNLTGAFLCCREAARYMKPMKSGVIVLTSSIYGVVAPDQRLYAECGAAKNIYGSDESLNCPAVYSASKAGLIGLGKHLAARWGKYNIRVNMLIPGGVYDGQEDAFQREYNKRTPLGRMAAWSDFNGAILFMVSDASSYMTGSNLVVDGGWTVW